MLKFGCILVYLEYGTLNLMLLMVYPKVLFWVDIHHYVQCLASGRKCAAAHLKTEKLCQRKPAS